VHNDQREDHPASAEGGRHGYYTGAKEAEDATEDGKESKANEPRKWWKHLQRDNGHNGMVARDDTIYGPGTYVSESRAEQAIDSEKEKDAKLAAAGMSAEDKEIAEEIKAATGEDTKAAKPAPKKPAGKVKAKKKGGKKKDAKGDDSGEGDAGDEGDDDGDEGDQGKSADDKASGEKPDEEKSDAELVKDEKLK